MAFEYLAQYTTFESVADMDTAVEEHIAAHYYDLTPAERAIVFKLASHSLNYPGVCHLKASTIADSLEISTKTVYRAIKKLESLGIIKRETTTKVKGGRGANIYIILPYQLETSESPVKHFEQNVVVTLQDAYNQANVGTAACKAFMNEYQQMLFEFMYSLPMQDNLKDQLHKCILATKINNIRDFVNAKNVLANIICDITNGTLTVARTLRAVFVGAFNKAVERSNNKQYKSSSIEETVDRERPVPFYNWLTERDRPTEVF
ncbi:helix-turn-helix domain-containing protein [Lysinibacillus sp. FSL K6-0075]|uniref:helix-turn-helix domain-containing protein n=1 Tax=Lysinibacillus sp. FSL K6-0075 TaxID=2921415 RepID=UPI00315800FC